jgi:hypothetical protein
MRDGEGCSIGRGKGGLVREREGWRAALSMGVLASFAVAGVVIADGEFASRCARAIWLRLKAALQLGASPSSLVGVPSTSRELLKSEFLLG